MHSMTKRSCTILANDNELQIGDHIIGWGDVIATTLRGTNNYIVTVTRQLNSTTTTTTTQNFEILVNTKINVIKNCDNSETKQVHAVTVEVGNVIKDDKVPSIIVGTVSSSPQSVTVDGRDRIIIYVKNVANPNAPKISLVRLPYELVTINKRPPLTQFKNNSKTPETLSIKHSEALEIKDVVLIHNKLTGKICKLVVQETIDEKDVRIEGNAEDVIRLFNSDKQHHIIVSR